MYSNVHPGPKRRGAVPIKGPAKEPTKECGKESAQTKKHSNVSAQSDEWFESLTPEEIGYCWVIRRIVW